MVELKLFHLPFTVMLCLPIYVVCSSSGSYSGYFDLTSQVLLAVVVLFLLCLPLVFVGVLRKRVLDVWTLFIVCASFSFLVMPLIASNWLDRWMFLLVYPSSFSVAVVLLAVFQSTNRMVRQRVEGLKWMNVSKKTTVALLSSMILMTSVYVGAALQCGNCVINSPVSRYYSVAPTVSIQDVEGTVQIMRWLDKNVDSGSCVLVPSAFLEWAPLHLDGVHQLVAYSSDAAEALNVATSQGYGSVYLVWYGENVGWSWFRVPSGFRIVFQSGRMAAFQYLG